MAQVATVVLMPQTSYINPGDGTGYDVTGTAFPAASYYINSKDIQTINLVTTGFTGTVVVEATLSADATTASWFEVYRLTASIAADPSSSDYLNSTTKTYTNINGNFVYMRAKVLNIRTGSVDFIKLSY